MGIIIGPRVRNSVHFQEQKQSVTHTEHTERSRAFSSVFERRALAVFTKEMNDNETRTCLCLFSIDLVFLQKICSPKPRAGRATVAAPRSALTPPESGDTVIAAATRTLSRRLA